MLPGRAVHGFGIRAENVTCPAVRALEASAWQAGPHLQYQCLCVSHPLLRTAGSRLFLCLLLGRAGVNRKLVVIISVEG